MQTYALVKFMCMHALVKFMYLHLLDEGGVRTAHQKAVLWPEQCEQSMERFGFTAYPPYSIAFSGEFKHGIDQWKGSSTLFTQPIPSYFLSCEFKHGNAWCPPLGSTNGLMSVNSYMHLSTLLSGRGR